MNIESMRLPARIYAAPPPAPDTPASSEGKAIAEKLERAFLAYREATEERFAELEKIGNETPEMRAKLAKADEDIAALQDSLDEALRNLGRITAGGPGPDSADPQKEIQAAAEFFAGKEARTSVRIDDDALAEYRAYRDGFVTYLKEGKEGRAFNNPEFRAAMQVGSDPDGGYWVPSEMSMDIKRRLFETSPMRQISSVMSITTDSIVFPNDTNDGTSGGWVGETESRTETSTPEVGEQEIYVREQYAEPRVTQKLLDMATIDVEAWLNAKIADKMSRTENTAFVSGTGVKQPRGFLDYKSAAVTTDDASRSWGVLQYTASGAAGAFPNVSGSVSNDPDSLITMISKLKPAYRPGAVFVMNRATEATIRKLKDADGRYFVGMGSLSDGVTGFNLFGFPIVTAEDMPALASDSYSVAFGNFNVGYQIVDGRGLRILRDPFTTKPYVKFYTTKWTGGDVVNFDAIKLMKFATS